MLKNKDKIYTDPCISPANATRKDLSKEWYVWFRYLDSGKWRQVRKKSGINYISDFRMRCLEANALREQLKEMLDDGWNPFAPTEIPKDNISPFWGKTTVELIEDFYLIKKNTMKSPHNYKIAKNHFTARLNEIELSDIEPSDFTPQLAHSFLDWLSLKNITNTTWNNYKDAIQFLFNMFTARKIIGVNPFAGISNKKPNPAKNKAFSPDEDSTRATFCIICLS